MTHSPDEWFDLLACDSQSTGRSSTSNSVSTFSNSNGGVEGGVVSDAAVAEGKIQVKAEKESMATMEA
jgi:hypothetical protein